MPGLSPRRPILLKTGDADLELAQQAVAVAILCLLLGHFQLLTAMFPSHDVFDVTEIIAHDQIATWPAIGSVSASASASPSNVVDDGDVSEASHFCLKY